MTHIRPAQPEDCQRIAELYRQLVSDSSVNVLAARIEENSRDASTGLFVCEHNGLVEGTALVSLCADVMYGYQPFAVVENIVINEAQRGHGLGAALLDHVEIFCLSKDCSKIMLLSSVQRADAHRLFEKAGFSGSSKRGFVKYRSQFSP